MKKKQGYELEQNEQRKKFPKVLLPCYINKYETVFLADFMPKMTYFWQPVSVKLWPFFEFQVSFSGTAVKLLTVSREFSKYRLPRVKVLFFVLCTKSRIFPI